MSILDRLLPPRCLLCGDPGSAGMALCRGCDDDLIRNHQACARCAEPLPATAPDQPDLRVCGACLWRPPPYSAIHAPFIYAPPLDWLIQRFKFRGDLVAGRLLGQLLARELANCLPADTRLVPIPLHPRRLQERGYNQATELARPLARALPARLTPSVLERTLSTAPQMELPAAARRSNVIGAFRSRQAVSGPVTLIDDVITTANTVREAARTLAIRPGMDIRVCALARARVG